MPRLVASGLDMAEFVRVTAENPLAMADLEAAMTPTHAAPLRPRRLSREVHGAIVVLMCFLLEALTLSSRSFFAVVLDDWQRDFGLSVTAVRQRPYSNRLLRTLVPLEGAGCV